MQNNAYYKALRTIMADKSPAAPTTRTMNELEADITSISAALRTRLSNEGRLILVESRSELRKQLAAIDGAGMLAIAIEGPS